MASSATSVSTSILLLLEIGTSGSMSGEEETEGWVSALSTYGPLFLRTIPPLAARDGAGLIISPWAVQFERRV